MVFFLGFVLVSVISSCSYSFTGASLPPDVKTISIEPLINEAPVVAPYLAQDFTEALRNKFVQQTSLRLEKSNADLQFVGVITDYTIMPMTIQGNDQAAQNRMTIRIKMKYVNERYPERSWEQTFEQFVDFPREANIASREREFNAEIIEKISQDVFNKSLADW